MRQIDYMPDGVTAGYDRTITYNGAGQIDTETVISRQGTETWKNVTTNQYGTGANYALGAVTYSSTTASKLSNGYYAQQYVSTSTNNFYWFEGAAVANTYVTRTGMTGSSSIFYYNEVGELQYASVGGSRPRTVYYKNGIDGQVLRRDEYDNYTSAGDPHEAWYRFGGKQMGYVGNNGTEDQDYTASIAQRTAAQSTWAFRNGSLSHTSHADFDQSLAPINSYSRGAAGGSYLVQSGDTLAGIAAQLWGDSSLWYKIADANGLAANAALAGGQRLTIPAGVMKNTHNAGTFTPYDPSEALGDVGPSPIPRGKSNKCGFFGAILMVAVAVAVAAVTAGGAVAALAPAALKIGTIGAGITALATGGTGLGAATLVGIGAAAGAAGSIASQGLGVAMGLQDKISWKGVAMAAIAGGVGAGVGQALPMAKLGGSVFLANAARGAAASFITQGIAVATGLQNKFDWAGVAAAGIGSGVAGSLTRSAGVDKNLANASEHLRGAASSMAGAIANGAVRSLLDGSNFGDNILAAIPDVIGSTLGNMLAGGLAGRPRLGYDMTGMLGEGLAGGGAAYGGSQPAGISATALSAPGVGNGVAQAPTTGVNGGQVGEEIIVTGTRLRGAALSAYETRQLAASAREAGATEGGGRARWDGWYRGVRYQPTDMHTSAFLLAAYENPDPLDIRLGITEKQFGALAPDDPQSLASRIIAENPTNYRRIEQVVERLKYGAVAHPEFAEFINPQLERLGAVLLGMADIKAAADRASFDLFRMMAPILDFPTAGIRMFGYGEYNLENGLTIGGGLLGPLGGAGARFLGRGGTAVIENVDPSILARSHAIGGDSSTKTVNNIAGSMRSNGFMGDPIDVILDGGRMVVVDGHHRRAAAILTGTSVNVRVLKPDAFPIGSGGWQSVDDVLRAADTVGPNTLRHGRRR